MNLAWSIESGVWNLIPGLGFTSKDDIQEVNSETIMVVPLPGGFSIPGGNKVVPMKVKVIDIYLREINSFYAGIMWPLKSIQILKLCLISYYTNDLHWTGMYDFNKQK